jgi:hypothetical protein
MRRILAIETDSKRQQALTTLVRERVAASLVVVGSVRGRVMWRQRTDACRGLQRPAAAQPMRPAPPSMSWRPRQERWRAPAITRPAPAAETSHGPNRSSIATPFQPRLSHTL